MNYLEYKIPEHWNNIKLFVPYLDDNIIKEPDHLREKRRIIYRIANMINGKIYIGKTEDSFYERYQGGQWWKYTHNKELKEDYNKFGADAFIVDIFESNLNEEDLKWLEEFSIFSHNSLHPNGYNKVMYSGEKAIYSDITRKKMSESQKELRKRIPSPFKGKKHSEESKKLMSEKLKGKKHTEEFKKMMSERMSGPNHYSFGKSPPPKTREKMREAKLGKTLSAEHKEKIRKGNEGKCNSKPVLKISKDTNEILAVYKTMHNASVENGISGSCISNVCNGKRQTAGGFKWKFKKDIL